METVKLSDPRIVNSDDLQGSREIWHSYNLIPDETQFSKNIQFSIEKVCEKWLCHPSVRSRSQFVSGNLRSAIVLPEVIGKEI